MRIRQRTYKPHSRQPFARRVDAGRGRWSQWSAGRQLWLASRSGDTIRPFGLVCDRAGYYRISRPEIGPWEFRYLGRRKLAAYHAIGYPPRLAPACDELIDVDSYHEEGDHVACHARKRVRRARRDHRNCRILAGDYYLEETKLGFSKGGPYTMEHCCRPLVHCDCCGGLTLRSTRDSACRCEINHNQWDNIRGTA